MGRQYRDFELLARRQIRAPQPGNVARRGCVAVNDGPDMSAQSSVPGELLAGILELVGSGVATNVQHDHAIRDAELVENGLNHPYVGRALNQEKMARRRIAVA